MRVNLDFGTRRPAANKTSPPYPKMKALMVRTIALAKIVTKMFAIDAEKLRYENSDENVCD